MPLFPLPTTAPSAPVSAATPLRQRAASDAASYAAEVRAVAMVGLPPPSSSLPIVSGFEVGSSPSHNIAFAGRTSPSLPFAPIHIATPLTASSSPTSALAAALATAGGSTAPIPQPPGTCTSSHSASQGGSHLASRHDSRRGSHVGSPIDQAPFLPPARRGSHVGSPIDQAPFLPLTQTAALGSSPLQEGGPLFSLSRCNSASSPVGSPIDGALFPLAAGASGVAASAAGGGRPAGAATVAEGGGERATAGAAADAGACAISTAPNHLGAQPMLPTSTMGVAGSGVGIGRVTGSPSTPSPMSRGPAESHMGLSSGPSTPMGGLATTSPRAAGSISRDHELPFMMDDDDDDESELRPSIGEGSQAVETRDGSNAAAGKRRLRLSGGPRSSNNTEEENEKDEAAIGSLMMEVSAAPSLQLFSTGRGQDGRVSPLSRSVNDISSHLDRLSRTLNATSGTDPSDGPHFGGGRLLPASTQQLQPQQTPTLAQGCDALTVPSAANPCISSYAQPCVLHSPYGSPVLTGVLPPPGSAVPQPLGVALAPQAAPVSTHNEGMQRAAAQVAQPTAQVQSGGAGSTEALLAASSPPTAEALFPFAQTTSNE